MSDRRYFRANFSTATTPTSSGGRATDVWGNEYGRIALQLSNNLIDTTRTPREITMLLTKLSIPLGSVPVGSIGLDHIDEAGNGALQIVTKGRCFCWPFAVAHDGTITPSAVPTGFSMPHGTSGGGVRRMTYNAPAVWDANRISVLSKLQGDAYCPFFKIGDLLHFMTLNVTNCFMAAISHDPTVTHADRYRILFQMKDSRLHVIMERHDQSGAPIIRNSRVFTPDHTTYYPYMDAGSISQDNSWSPSSNSNRYGVGICVNKFIKDMFPGLPWKTFDNSRLVSPYKIVDWEVANYGDSNFYMLDTEAATTDAFWQGPIYTSGSSFRRSMALDMCFEECNLLSSIPISGFLVTMNGVSITTQTFPANINPGNESSALTTSIPIIEVYYPLWQNVWDISTNLVVSKDAFTDAAPFTLGPDALAQRDIQFRIYYVYNDGRIEELTIPSGTSLNLQVCYSIAYY